MGLGLGTLAACGAIDEEGTKCTPNAPCVHYSPPTGCAAGLVCVGESRCGGGSGEGICRRPRARGQACPNDAPCEDPHAHQCAIDGPERGTCAPIHEYGVGEPCDPRTRRCRGGLQCVGPEGRYSTNPPLPGAVCVELGGIGAPCGDPLHDCQSYDAHQHVHCDADTRLCSGPGAAGAACQDGRDCATETCSGNRCAAPLPDGAACDRYEQCQSRKCDASVCVAREAADAGS